MRIYQMEVGKKEDGATIKVGEVAVYYPLLSELGLAIDPASYESFDKEGKTVVATVETAGAFPVYADEKVQYVFDAVLAAVKASARNKLLKGTVELKPDNKIAETVEELLATAERSGAALAARREFLSDLKAFLPSLGKSQAYTAQLYDIISNVKGICVQSTARKALISDVVGQFAGKLDAEKLGKYERILGQIAEQVEAESELPD